MQLPQAVTARKMMNDVVANSQPQLMEGGRGNVVTFGSYDLQLSGRQNGESFLFCADITVKDQTNLSAIKSF